MVKKKKSIITFLLLVTAIYAIWTTINDMSNEFNLPIPIIVLFIIGAYLMWKD